MGEGIPTTAKRQLQIAATARGGTGLIAPPYHILDVDLLYLVCRFDIEAARRVLPPPLEPNPDGLGVIMLLNAPRGWVIAPFTGCVTTLSLQGFDGPDQYPANYVHTAFYSDQCGEIFRQVYNDRITDGFARLRKDGDRIVGTAGRDGEDTIRVSARVTDRVTDEIVGMNHYLSSLGDTIQVYSTSYNASFRDVEDVSIEILDTAPEPLRSLKPLEVVWSLWLEGMSMLFNPMRTLGAEVAMVSADKALAAIFDLLKRFKRPAAVVGPNGHPLFVTKEAMGLFGQGEQWSLPASRLLTDGEQRRVGDPVLAQHPSGRPLLAQVVPIMSGLGAEPLRLVLFADPTGQRRSDLPVILELLGLTPAEARLAARVGAGISPQEAASELDITTNTARSTMKTIFSKLGVSRQAQLAQLVTRLETI